MMEGIKGLPIRLNGKIKYMEDIDILKKGLKF